MSEFSMDDAFDVSFVRNPIDGHKTLMKLIVEVVFNPIRSEVFSSEIEHVLSPLVVMLIASHSPLVAMGYKLKSGNCFELDDL